MSNSKERRKMSIHSPLRPLLCQRSLYCPGNHRAGYYLEKKFVISIWMCLLNHFVDFLFQYPSFMFLSFSGARSLSYAGLHLAEFILHRMTNCIWICRVERSRLFSVSQPAFLTGRVSVLRLCWNPLQAAASSDPHECLILHWHGFLMTDSIPRQRPC